MNYHRWDVCKAAVLLGEKENVPVYKFLREPLIRKFGEDWYRELEIAVDEHEKARYALRNREKGFGLLKKRFGV